MAYTTQDQSQSFFSRAASSLGAMGMAASGFRSADARATLFDRLQKKSDEELREMGLTRDDIPRYVFRDLLHI